MSVIIEFICTVTVYTGNLLTFDETLQTRLNLMQITLDLNCSGYLL